MGSRVEFFEGLKAALAETLKALTAVSEDTQDGCLRQQCQLIHLICKHSKERKKTDDFFIAWKGFLKWKVQIKWFARLKVNDLWWRWRHEECNFLTSMIHYRVWSMVWYFLMSCARLSSETSKTKTFLIFRAAAAVWRTDSMQDWSRCSLVVEQRSRTCGAGATCGYLTLHGGSLVKEKQHFSFETYFSLQV